MIITYSKISQISFPVFKLAKFNWREEDGLIFLGDKILDDRNQPGETLGIRRLQTPHKNLYRMRCCIDNHLGIIKQIGDPFYVDNKGLIFIYKKTLNCKLHYHEITKVERRDVASLIRVKGVRQPFTVPRPPTHGALWAGVLYLHGLPWMLYEYSEEKKKSTTRKV